MENTKKKINLVSIVDDDRLYQFTAQKTIEKIGLVDNIISFENGKDALNNLIANQYNIDEVPDIIFLDINMPIMDSWEFLEAYKQIKSNLIKIPTIYVITSSIDESDKEKTRNIEEVSNLLIKPIKREQLVALFQQYLEKEV